MPQIIAAPTFLPHATFAVSEILPNAPVSAQPFFGNAVCMNELQLDPKTTALILIDLENGIVSGSLAPHSGADTE